MGVPGWFSRGRTESDRFDDAVHASPGAGTDEFADELAVVAALRELGEAGSPDLATRTRIRTEIESRIGEPLPRRRWRPRMADLAAAGIALILGTAGLTLLLSRDAVPGDALYQVKRAGEVTSLGLTFGDAAKAERHLEFAANRVADLGHMGEASPAAYQTALNDFRSDLQAGVAGLTELATKSSDHGQLTTVQSWAQSQQAALKAEEATIPAPALSDFRQAQALLNRVQQRTTALGSRMNCYRITSGSTDDLGLLPARGACTQQPPVTLPVTPAPSTPTPSAPATDSPLPLRSVSSPNATGPGSPAPTPLPGTDVPHPTPPPSYPAPIPTPTAPRIPSRPPQPPVISVPPLLPGLPPVAIG